MWWWPGGTWVSALEFPHADSQVPLKALGCSFSSYHTRPTAPIWLLSWPENYFSHTLLRTTTKHLDMFLDVIVKVKVIQLCLTLCDPMDYTVHGILQARILELVAYPFSSGSSQPRNGTRVSWIAGRFFTNWDIREALMWSYNSLNIKCKTIQLLEDSIGESCVLLG